MTEDKNGSEHVEGWLSAWQNGDEEALKKLLSLMYQELSKISHKLLAREVGISLSAGDLVNEAAIRLFQGKQIDLNDKSHFLALSAKVMRQVLIDYWRKKHAQKRHHQKVTLLTEFADYSNDRFALDLSMLEDALLELGEIDEDKVKLIEMRYYAGMSLEQIANVMGVSESTTKRSWRVARAWLLHKLNANA